MQKRTEKKLTSLVTLLDKEVEKKKKIGSFGTVSLSLRTYVAQIHDVYTT